MKILITGGNGFIAKEIHKYLKNEYEIHCLSREQLNLLDKESIYRRAIEFYDVVINAAVVGGYKEDEDNENVFYDNMLMMENLLSSLNDNQILINFSSGAEFRSEDTAYGLAKRISTRLINARKNSYNLRLYGCFSFNESDERFIKRCFNRNEVIINDDIEFDFFYGEDLARVCKFLIDGGLGDNIRSNLNEKIKDIDCVYDKKYKLSDVAKIIKTNYKPELEVSILNSYSNNSYTGNSRVLQNIEIFFEDKLIGLEKGLEAVNEKH